MFSNAAMQAMSAAYGLLGGNFVSPRIGGYGLLGMPQAQPPQGYGQTGNMMQQYLQNLYMRRYNPPALAQYPGMVGSRMGQGGMQYMAPQLQQLAPPGKTEMQRMQEQLAAMQAQMQPQGGFDSGW